jgi:hypothetical protein
VLGSSSRDRRKLEIDADVEALKVHLAQRHAEVSEQSSCKDPYFGSPVSLHNRGRMELKAVSSRRLQLGREIEPAQRLGPELTRHQ